VLLKQNDLPVELQLTVRGLNTIANTATAKITYAESVKLTQFGVMQP